MQTQTIRDLTRLIAELEAVIKGLEVDNQMLRQQLDASSKITSVFKNRMREVSAHRPQSLARYFINHPNVAGWAKNDAVAIMRIIYPG